MERQYDADADLMRVVASFFVVMTHAATVRSSAAIAYNCLARFSVPVFILLSGYYMLARPVDGKRVAKKCASLFALLLAWSAVFCGYDLLCGARSFEGVGALAAYLLTQPFHLWYLWALIALYLFTPPLSVFAAHATREQYRYALALTFLVGSPLVIALRSGRAPVLAEVVERMKLAYLLGFVFCYLLGGYFRKWGCALGGARERRTLYLLGAAGTAAGALVTCALSADGTLNDLLMSLFAPNVLVGSVAFFVAVKQLCAERTLKCRAALRELADCTLGVYLLHPLILLMLQRSATAAHIFYGGSDLIFAPVRTAFAFTAAALAVMLLRRVPVLRRLFLVH